MRVWNARGIVSVILSALTLGSSVAVPLLERGGFVGHATVESEHDPTRCPRPHDHRVCTQVGANLAIVSDAQDHRVAHVFVDAATPGGPSKVTAKPLLEGPPSRAPPLA
jgi:hypothetical protein